MIIWPVASSFDWYYNHVSIPRFGLPAMFEITESGQILYGMCLAIKCGSITRVPKEKEYDYG